MDRPYRLPILVLLTVLTAWHCNKSTPSAPTPLAASDGLNLSNFQAQELGLVENVCGESYGWNYTALDQLLFQVNTTNLTGVVGGTIYSYETGRPVASVGVIQQCAASTQPPCQSDAGATICLVSSGSTGGVIQVYNRTEWSPQRKWQISITTASGDRVSNVVDATINRPEHLPSGANAAVAQLLVTRVGGTSGTFRYSVYSPGVAGRKITVIREVFSGGTRLSTSQTVFNEVITSIRISGFGGVTLGAGETDVVYTVEERDAAGALLATDAKHFTVS